MNKRTFGQTGRKAGEIGLGCWQLGGADWGALGDDQADAILDAAADAGTTFFDTADVYGDGRSEELIGKFLRRRKGDFFVATKLGRRGDIYPDGYTWDAVSRATEDSLRRLGVEALDLTQLHCIPEAVLRAGEIFDWLRRLQEQGKIRNFGASVETVEEGLLCLGQPGLASLQVIFNIFRQKPAIELFPAALAKRVAVIVRVPLASGLLGGRMTRETVFPEKDHRNYNRDGQFFNVGETFCGLPFGEGIRLVERLDFLKPADISLPRMALRYILDHEAVSVVIPGASKPQQARENACASNLPPLPPALHRELRDFYTNEVAGLIRGPY